MQGSPSEPQFLGTPLQIDAAQVSFSVQGLLSLHGSAFGACVHPTRGLHESIVQGLLSLQFNGVPDVQPAAWLHVSSPLQILLSLHWTSVYWQPTWNEQVSVVQAFPSLQSMTVAVQPLPVSQASSVHALPSLH